MSEDEKSPPKGVDSFVGGFILISGTNENLDSSPVIATQRQDNGSQGIEKSIPCFFYRGLDYATK
ncbi:MAG: hypothetical protein E3J56_08260 [Candidatus Aminicenantes bacterium]|nr:MAG: hypothetical protein E3J56_08260 [Candidatus Aminicenantes bacterium]